MSKTSTAPVITEKQSDEVLSAPPQAPAHPGWNAYEVWRKRVLNAQAATPKKPVGTR
jgi:hypothetical protein